MDNFEMALALIKQAQNESIRLMTFNRTLDEARATPGYTWEHRMKIESQFSPIPRKSIVNDSLKMARRLLKEEYV